VLRIGAPFTPPPAGTTLEALFVPSAERVVGLVRELVEARPVARSS
jgi:hypothetical protein